MKLTLLLLALAVVGSLGAPSGKTQAVMWSPNLPITAIPIALPPVPAQEELPKQIWTMNTVINEVSTPAVGVCFMP